MVLDELLEQEGRVVLEDPKLPDLMGGEDTWWAVPDHVTGINLIRRILDETGMDLWDMVPDADSEVEALRYLLKGTSKSYLVRTVLTDEEGTPLDWSERFYEVPEGTDFSAPATVLFYE